MAEHDVDVVEPDFQEDLAKEDEAPEDAELELEDSDELEEDGESDAAATGEIPVGEDGAALSELAAEELELLAEEEETGADIRVDEAAELRAIRREELTMNVATKGASQDEFVCSSCFLVLKTSQLANKRKSLCRDCAA